MLDVCELSERELSDGDKRPEVFRTAVLTGVGSARFLPLPSTRPPPRLLLVAISTSGQRAPDLVWTSHER